MRAAAVATITGFTLLLFAAAPSFAYHWAHFEPCGYVMPEGPELIPDTGESPHFDAMYVHRNHIVGAFEAEKRPHQKGPPCTILVLSNGIRRPVIGTLNEVMRKLRGGP